MTNTTGNWLSVTIDALPAMLFQDLMGCGLYCQLGKVLAEQNEIISQMLVTSTTRTSIDTNGL